MSARGAVRKENKGTLKKLTALVLTWVVPATSVWASAPPTHPAGSAAVAATASLDVPSFGILVGQVLSDATGLSVPEATVRLAGSSAGAQPVDLEGRFGLPASPGAHVVVAEKDGFVAVERGVSAVAGQGAAVLDARLTPLGAPVTLGPSGGTVTAGEVTATVGPGAVSEDTGFIVTLLSGQGLPNRLPLGFAPVLAFDFRAGRAVAGPFAVRLRGLSPAAAVHLVEYRASDHAWHLTDASLIVSDGEANASLPALGAYAVVTADEGGPGLPGPGAPLTGSNPVPSPPGLTGTATVEPIRVPASGATARGRLTATSPVALPSGTVLQARLTESFTLGSVRIEDEPRLHDVVAYRSQPALGQTLKATIPLTAVRTFGSAEPVAGRLRLEFWTGRPSLAGSVGGGSESVTVESGPARLVVAAGSLPTDTAVSIQSVPLSAFLPAAAGVTALGEVVVDLSGALLGQGAELSLSSSASGTLVIARVERFSGVPYLTVVSLAEAQGGRIVSAPYPGLPGIVRGGRYVFYRLDDPIGFVAGTTSSPAGPVRAVVGTAGLPFVGVSSVSGSYITAATAGAAVEVTGRVPGTPHQATATVAVTAGETTTRDLTLTAGLTTVAVVPADGATGIAVSVSVQLTASQPLDAATLTATTVRLIKGNPDSGPTVDTRRVLSADGRTLSVVPESPLEPATVYVLRVAGLTDAYGGPVNVADVHFTTRADATPEYDLGKLRFSFPNASGIVSVTAATGSFPPATTLMVVNERNGAVLTMTVDNEGALNGEIPATLDDVMTVSLEDPQGNELTGRLSKYVDLATGRTSIGSTGGVVEGTGGVELRLPPGAVNRGVVFKAEAVAPGSVPPAERPQVPNGTLGAVLKVEAPSMPAFRKEVDLAFPKPADAPAGAFFYVYRKVQGPGGVVLHQTLDSAAVEGDKVVTNSPPFGGYTDSLGGFGLIGEGSVSLTPQAWNYAYLMWTFDLALTYRSPMAVFNGRVTRREWNAAERRWENAPVKGAVVRLLVDGQDPFRDPGATALDCAVTADDGVYTFFSPGLVQAQPVLRATVDGEDRDTTGYLVPQPWGPTWVRVYAAWALTNFEFTSAAPAAELSVERLVPSESGWRRSDSAFATTGTTLFLGFRAVNAAVQSASVNGDPLPLEPVSEAAYDGMTHLGSFVPFQPGTLTVTLTAQPESGPSVSRSITLLAIADGGTNNEPLPGPPRVLEPQSWPRTGATGVSPLSMPRLVLSEPVTNVVKNGSLRFFETANPTRAVDFNLRGAGPGGIVAEVVAASLVSSLTLEPRAGLKSGTRYTIEWQRTIVDLDPPEMGGPKELPAGTIEFTTFDPSEVGGTNGFATAGLTVLGDRAYVVENVVQNLTSNGLLRAFDVSDPAHPTEIPPQDDSHPVPERIHVVPGRPVDVAGQDDETAITNGRLVLVGTTVAGARSRPSNIHAFDVSGDLMRPVGVVSVTTKAADGILHRVAAHGSRAFGLTQRKGLFVVDLQRARQNYEAGTRTLEGYWDMVRKSNEDGVGFSRDAVVASIPVGAWHPAPPPHPQADWRDSLLYDFKVGDYRVDGVPQTLAVATGTHLLPVPLPDGTVDGILAVVRTDPGNQYPHLVLANAEDRLTQGFAVALGRLGARDVAVVVGLGVRQDTGGLPPLMAVVDLTNPAAPQVLSILDLGEGDWKLTSEPTDVVLDGHVALVASAEQTVLVSLLDPLHPHVVGQAEGVGGRLALGLDGIVFSSLRTLFAGGDSLPLSGIRINRYEECDLLDLLTPELLVDLVQDPINNQSCGTPARAAFKLCRPGRVTLTLNGQPVTAPVDDRPPALVSEVPLDAGIHVVTLPPGVLGMTEAAAQPFRVMAKAIGGGDDLAVADGTIRNRVRNRSVLPVGHTFVKGVDVFKGHVVAQAVDLKLGGRHLNLEATRSYSSSGSSGDGLLGAGWSWNYESQLIRDSCNRHTVVTADGSSQVFAPGPGDGFTSQRGYHTQLRREAAGFVFTDKAGNEHRFREETDPGHWRLDFIEEPHGDRIVPKYDPRGRVSEVWEVLRESPSVPARKLVVTYARAGQFERIRSVRAVGEDGHSLGLSATYAYDDWGNLLSARREDRFDSAAGVGRAQEQYGYSWFFEQDRHQLLRSEDPDGQVVTYQYLESSDPLPGAPGGLEKREFVKAVQEYPAGTAPSETRFAYDASGYGTPPFTWTTVVTDPRGHPTTYLLNSGGSPLEVREPLGKTTKMGWRTSDVLKEWEEDAEGRRTDYDYDASGNLKTETIQAGDLGAVVTRYEYHPRFNKLEKKTDAEGHETTHEIDDATGDLLQTRDAVGNVTAFTYSAGRLQTVRDPRGGITTHSSWDSYGNATHTEHLAGRITDRVYDERGRITEERDNHGHQTLYEYGGFDRVRKATRVAGGASDDEVKETEHSPGGRVLKETSPGGVVTEYERDGLGRITKATLRVPAPFEGRSVETITEEVLEYDGNGNKLRERDRRGVLRRYEYDELNRLRQAFVGDQPVAEYDHDRVGNRRYEINSRTGARTDFEYDGLYRLKRKQLPESRESGARYEERYAHDKVGNRTSAIDAEGRESQFDHDGLGRVTWSKNALDQIATVKYDEPPGAHVDKSEEHDPTRGLRSRFKYDTLGRETLRTVLLEKPAGSEKTYTTTTAYDDAERKATVTVSGEPSRVRVAYQDGLDRVVGEGPLVGGQELLTETAYDGLGNKKRVLDPERHETLLVHDGLGRLVRTRDGEGFVSEAFYYPDGLKRRERDRRVEGIWRSFEYDPYGRLTLEKLDTTPITGRGWQRRLSYDDAARTRSEYDALDQRTLFHLDKMDRVVQVTDIRGESARIGYDGVDKVWEKDKRGFQRDFQYDALHRLTLVTDPAVGGVRYTERTEYLDAALQKRATDRRGKETLTQLDPLGRLLSVTRAGVLRERHEYDASGNRVLSVDGEGNKTRFLYDGAHRLEKRTDGFEAANPEETSETTFTYDRDGLVETERDARAATLGQPFSVRNAYNSAHRLTSVTDGEGHTTEYGYDGEGNRTRVRETLGQETTFQYEELGKIARVTQPASAPGQPLTVTRYAYDSVRNLTEQRDATGQESRVVRMQYDTLNRLWKRIQPGGITTELAYDDDGNVEWTLDPKGQKVTNTYDSLSRLTQKDFTFTPGSPYRPWRHTTKLEYLYDGNHNLTQVTDHVASGNDPPPPNPPPSIVRTYDDFDRLQSETTRLPDTGASRTLSFAYFANGLRHTVTDPLGQVTTYAYDAQKRLKSATAAGGATAYTYWPDSLLKEVTYPSSVKATHAYDLADRLTSLANTRAATPISSYTYTYDQNGNRLSQTEANGGLTEQTTYTYDDLNRLLTVTYPLDATYPAGRVVTYGYDPVGNRERETTRNPAGTVLADKQGIFDSLNRLTALNDLLTPASSTTFGWDLNGNQITKTTAGVTTEYRYDIRDKLVEVVQGELTPGRFQYDAEGRRTKKIGTDGVRQYVYDQTSLLAEYDGSGNQVAKYEYGSDRLISLTRGPQKRFYLFDALRSVTNLTDEAGNTQASYHLDAWGNFRFPSELNSSDSASSQNRFAFTGYLWDQETSLYFAKARFYDPEVGRFTTQDSYLGELSDPPSLHRYFYGNANPTRYIDPTGHAAKDWIWAAAKEAERAAKATFNTALGPLRTPFNVAKRSIEEKSVVAGVRGEFRDTFNTFGAMDAAERPYREGRGLAKAAEEGARAHLGNMAASAVPIHESLTLLDSNADGWEKAEAAANFVAKAGSLYLGLRGAPRAAVVQETASTAGSRLVPAEGVPPPALRRIPAQGLRGGAPTPDEAAGLGGRRTFTSDDPHVADVANAIEARYPGHVQSVNRVMRDAQGKTITDLDIETANAVIQVKSRGRGLAVQLEKTQAVTDKPVIGFGPELTEKAVRRVEKRGGLVTTDREVLLDVISPDPQTPKP